MTDATYVIAVVMVGTFVVTWTLRRLIDRFHDPLGAVSGIVIRVGLGLILALVGARAAISGGYAWIAVPFLGLLALWNFVLAVGMIWAWAHEGLDDNGELSAQPHSQSE